MDQKNKEKGHQIHKKYCFDGSGVSNTTGKITLTINNAFKLSLTLPSSSADSKRGSSNFNILKMKHKSLSHALFSVRYTFTCQSRPQRLLIQSLLLTCGWKQLIKGLNKDREVQLHHLRHLPCRKQKLRTVGVSLRRTVRKTVHIYIGVCTKHHLLVLT